MQFQRLIKIRSQLRDARVVTGLGQEKRAYKMHPSMSREYLNRIENDKHPPTLAALETLCKTLGVPTCSRSHSRPLKKMSRSIDTADFTTPSMRIQHRRCLRHLTHGAFEADHSEML